MTCEVGVAARVEDMRSGDRRNEGRIALSLLLIVLAALANGSGCSKGETNYTGLWKGNCSDYWGVLIIPAESGLYSVTFCGLSGCLQPGEWTPDTRIDGDPMYQIVSPTKIRIKRSDSGYFTYIRCSADPFWQAAPHNY